MPPLHFPEVYYFVQSAEIMPKAERYFYFKYNQGEWEINILELQLWKKVRNILGASFREHSRLITWFF